MSGKARPERLAELIAERIDLDALADKLADRVELRPRPDEWIDATEASRRYGYTARWWRDHADEFGAERDGDGPRARILFSVVRIERGRKRPPRRLTAT